MTYLLKVYPDAEGSVRTWLREQPSITDLVDQRVFLSGIPKNPVLPLITLSQVTEGEQQGDTPVENAWLQLDCWGSTKESASATKRAVKGVIESLEGGTVMGDARCLWATTVSSLWLPDPESNTPRYVITAEFAMTTYGVPQ